jgi:hypothetical protein
MTNKITEFSGTARKVLSAAKGPVGIVCTGFVLLLLTACQTNQKPFVPEAIAVPGDARVFVYWPSQTWRERAGSRPEIQVNGVPVGVLAYKSYIEVQVPSGTYELRMTGDSEAADWNGPDQAFTTPLEAGETKYVRLLVKFDQETNTLGHGLLDYVVQFLPRAEPQARLEMYGLRKIEE